MVPGASKHLIAITFQNMRSEQIKQHFWTKSFCQIPTNGNFWVRSEVADDVRVDGSRPFLKKSTFRDDPHLWRIITGIRFISHRFLWRINEYVNGRKSIHRLIILHIHGSIQKLIIRLNRKTDLIMNCFEITFSNFYII